MFTFAWVSRHVAKPGQAAEHQYIMVNKSLLQTTNATLYYVGK